MESISTSFFCRFIGVATEIKINESEVIIEVENRVIQLKWEELIVPPLFHLSFFGQILTFKTVEQNYVFTMLAYSAKRQQKENCERLWASVNIQRVETLLSTIKKITTNQYLRQSSIEKIHIAVKQEAKRWFPWVNLAKWGKRDETWIKLTEKLQLLSLHQRWSSEEVENLRENFITKQLQRYQTFFDEVESNPLTEYQRRACIIDNDNNLLLAGAGTGKTSVMVGRAGYLLNSGQAQNNDILLLAYGRKAADEMDERIRDKLATDKISATTFHSLGLNIIAQVEGNKPTLSILAEDEKTKYSWVQQHFVKCLNEVAEYRALVVEYLSHYYYVERSAFDFISLGEGYQYFNDNDIRSFKDEQLNNFGELYIANSLFSHGIEYQYKPKYVYDVKTTEGKVYRPNFFLPELNIYIEFYLIDENGNTPVYIDEDAYHKNIEWKQSTHQKNKTECIELTYGQHNEGKLIGILMQSLCERQKQCEQVPKALLSVESILLTLNESGRINALSQVLANLINLYKAANLGFSSAQAFKSEITANSDHPKQTEKMLALFNPILIAYEQHLSSRAEIDFEDMINKAIKYVETGQFQSPWHYIMVDEFQDISVPRARLVKALRDNNKHCSVFSVGDDWQAIYRFSGADVTLTTQFSQYFGISTQTKLDKTFRFNNQIGKVATAFISKNPAQINKTINALKQINTPAISLLKRANRQAKLQKPMMINEMENGAIDDVLSAISAKVCKPVNVLILARFWFMLPNSQDIKRLNNQYPLLTIDPQTFHASKGKEADYVIIVGMKKGVNGFPSEKATSSLLEAFLPNKESFKFAEERRLFYVALTRAKDKVYIISDAATSNDFINELENEHQIETNEFNNVASLSLIDNVNCPVCTTGILVKRSGRFGSFYACSHYPRCDHKEKCCAKCESPMTSNRFKGFKVCSNNSCQTLLPTCGKCHGEMVLRTSQKAKFWGCSNYKGNDPSSCKHSIDDAKINWPELVE